MLYEDAFKLCKEYFRGEDLPASVFLDKYALKDKDQNLLEATPVEMFERLASELARIEKKKFKSPLSKNEIIEYLKGFSRVVLQGSPMSGIGNNFQYTTISNCYVVESPLDSYSSICKSDEEIVQISKRRGGVGLDLSNLRPHGASTTNAARTSTGIIPFAERYSNTIREVGQSGRRGALMLSLSVHHPEVLDFAKCKRELNKVTGANISIRLTNEFLNAVKNNGKYEQRFPVTAREGDPKLVSRMVDAREVWSQIIEVAWATAEPGLLFWDRIIHESPADCYSSKGFSTISTNPCISGDTLVYLADGRGHLSIKQLAEEGKDAPVFCYDNKGKISIRTMRNPRITGYAQPIIKITMEDGCEIKVTHNHKIRLSSGKYKEAKDIRVGDSIKTLTKYEASLKDIFPKCNSNSQNYWWINDGLSINHAEHRIIAAYKYQREIRKKEVVHHIDRDAQNNNPNNLLIMNKSSHDALHSKNMIGDKNPYHRMTDQWKFNFASHPQDKNPNYSGVENEEIKKHAISLTVKYNRRFSKKEWMKYAKDNNLVAAFSKWREEKVGSLLELSQWAAQRCGVDHIDCDPRLVKTLQKAEQQGYKAIIKDHEVMVEKDCEQCGNKFYVNYFQREISVCGRTCSNHYLNERGANNKRTQTINKTYSAKADIIKNKQLNVFTFLRMNLQRDPLLKEVEQECKKQNISFRMKTKYGFKNFEELKQSASVYNHRVIRVESCGCEDVYNGTVDEFHNFFIGGFESKTKSSKRKYVYLNNLQCGELPLCSYDSCRLAVLNLFSYVKNPFTKDAYFDFDAFRNDAKILQRFMDDIIDIEIEKIEAIIKKIKGDPEPEDVKRNELEIWKKMKSKCSQGRRTGSGLTALGDSFAALGIKYGSPKSIEMTDKIYKEFKLACYRSSVEMAKELGPFEIWNFELEKNNPFLLRIKDEDSELYNEMQKVGRRNIACLTSAPAGSVSIETETSSGIEPLWKISHVRKKKINPNDKSARVDSVDQNGDSWQHFEIFHPKVKMWMEITKETDISKSPWTGCCAEDVNWVNRVKLQAVANKHIDHSISSTVNLPENISPKEVEKIYEAAWIEGCKGITIYRKNSRTGVMIDTGGTQNQNGKIQKTKAPKRPVILPAEIYYVTSKGEPYFIIVGLLQGEPYEVFAGQEKGIFKKISFKKGLVKKISRGRYSLLEEKGEVVVEDISKKIDEDQEAITRLISASLRHGCDVSFIVHQLEKVGGDMLSFAKAVSRVLKKYIPDDTIIHGESCQKCKSGNLKRADGCVICCDCGWSRC